METDYVFIVRENGTILVCQENPEWPTYVCNYTPDGIQWYIQNPFEKKLIQLALKQFLGQSNVEKSND